MKKGILKNIKSKQPVMGTLVITLMLIAIAIFFVGIVPERASAAYADFSYDKQITIDHTKIDSTLTDFPVWVYNTSSNFTSNILTNGSDIAFYNFTNETQFNHEIEIWNKTTGELGVWVNVTSISSSVDTIFYMYYGDANIAGDRNHNPTTVWQGTDIAIHHLNETGTKNNDSTSNNNNITAATGTTLYNQVGKVGKCPVFNATGYLEMADSPSFDVVDVFSCSLWANQIGKSSETNARLLSRFSTGGGFLITTYNNYYGGGIRNPSLVLQDHESGHFINNSWYYYTITYDGTTLYLYRNSTLVNSTTEAGLEIPSNYLTVCIGAYNTDYGEIFNGSIDEVRISHRNLSGAWIKACYENQNDVKNFLTFGTQGDEEASTYSIKGLPNNIITWSGIAGTTVWCNSTGDTHEWLEVNMSVNASENVTEIRVYLNDLNDTDAYVNASNITMYVTNSANTTYYSFGSFLDAGSNISINKTTWNTNANPLPNPFNGTGLKNINTSIFLIFKLAIPSSSPTDIFWSTSSTAWKIYLGHYT